MERITQLTSKLASIDYENSLCSPLDDEVDDEYDEDEEYKHYIYNSEYEGGYHHLYGMEDIWEN